MFGVLNQQSPIQTAERWNPILRYLAEKTGIPLRLKMGPTVAETDAMMGGEALDLIFTNHSFQASYDGKYSVLARWAGKPIRGVLAVLSSSRIGSLGDLQGRAVAFPSPDAFVAYAVPKVALDGAGVVVIEKFAGNQEGALAQLKAGRVDAAAVNSRFLEAYATREQLGYRTIHVSEPYHELAVMIHPRVPVAQAVALRQALLGMRDDPAAAEVLRQARCEGFEAAQESDYDNVRRIYRMIGK
ncbi:MAG: phosphate/phosphite/phosphonate ABC transporter substrate-binding protein [Pseudomonadota bacterium]